MNRTVLLVLIASAFAIDPAGAQILVAGNAANRAMAYPLISPGTLVFATLSGGGNFPPPVTLDPAYTAITVNGAAVPVVGSDGLRGVLFQLPPDSPAGYASIGIVLQPPGKGTGAWNTSLPVVATSFQAYTVGNGYGPALAANAITGAAVSMENPAHPGDIVSVWGTGLGGANLEQVSVLLGGHTAQVLYAGPAPGLPGVDQVNFTIPNDPSIPDGCFVALQVTSQTGYPNNIASLPKASAPGPCNSPYDFSAEAISQLESGAAVDTISYGISGFVYKTSGGPGFVRSESAYVLRAPIHLQTLSANNLLFAADVFYSCTPISASTQFKSGDNVDQAIYLIGEDTTVSGPSGSAAMPMGDLNLPTNTAVAVPSQLPDPFFVAGTWQISDAATYNPPALQAAIALPTPLALTDTMAAQSITAQQGYSYRWDPTGYTASDFISLNISAYGTVTCRAPATAGQISIPGSLIAQPPALTNGSVMIFALRRAGRGTPADLQIAPFTPGLFTYVFQISYPVQVQ